MVLLLSRSFCTSGFIMMDFTFNSFGILEIVDFAIVIEIVFFPRYQGPLSFRCISSSV